MVQAWVAQKTAKMLSVLSESRRLGGESKSGVRIYGVDSVDHVWFTNCALHNLLLEVDGLTQKWVSGVHKLTSNWDGDMGCSDYDGVQVDAPNALAHLSSNLDPRNYDSSGLGPGLDV